MDKSVAAAPSYARLRVGDRLPPLVLPAITRDALKQYAAASGDHNPNHVDIDAARAAGHEDVFAHGMLVMAWLGRLLTTWAPQECLLQFDVRFTNVTHVGDGITCTGEVTEKGTGDTVVLKLQATDQHGEVKVSGTAVLAL